MSLTQNPIQQQSILFTAAKLAWKVRYIASNTQVRLEEDLRMTNQRKNITQPADWWAAFEAQASIEGLSLAAWLGEAAKAKLPQSAVSVLSQRQPAHRPSKASQ
jgi:hypothetical protein